MIHDCTDSLVLYQKIGHVDMGSFDIMVNVKEKLKKHSQISHSNIWKHTDTNKYETKV